MEKPKVKIDRWYMDGDCLVGWVTGHPKLTEGALARTSKVINVDESNHRATTSNTVYELGEHFTKYQSQDIPKLELEKVDIEIFMTNVARPICHRLFNPQLRDMISRGWAYEKAMAAIRLSIESYKEESK